MISDIFLHLLHRNLKPHLYPNIVIDVDTNIVTFPIFSFDKRYVGFQQYNPNGDKKERKNFKLGKYFTYLSTVSVWGLESIELFNNDIVFVCEGVFKACRFHNWGYAAIATLTNNPKSIKKEILSLGKKVVVICDPDEAGKKLAPYGHICITPDKPIDDMTEVEFLTFLTNLEKEL